VLAEYGEVSRRGGAPSTRTGKDGILQSPCLEWWIVCKMPRLKVGIVGISPVSRTAPAGNADAADELHRLLLGVLSRPLTDDLFNLSAAFDARIHRRTAFVADQILATDQL